MKGTTENFTPGENLLGADDQDLLIDRAAAAGVANIVVGPRGDGRVVLFGSHPEFGSSLSLDDVSGSARMLTNAIAWQMAESGHPRRPEASVFAESSVTPAQVQADLERLPALVEQIGQLCERLGTRTADSPWLDDRYSMSMLGRPPREIWAAALRRMPELAAEAATHGGAVRADLVSFRSPAEWNVDGGFYGIVPLLDQAVGQLARAETSWVDNWPETVSDAYDHMLESPYHLVAGSIGRGRTRRIRGTAGARRARSGRMSSALMKAAAITGYGDRDNLAVLQLPAPTPGTGEVPVQLAYAGLNRADLFIRQGLTGPGVRSARVAARARCGRRGHGRRARPGRRFIGASG